MVCDLALWQRLHNYSMDAADAAFPFSQRLARDNGWSHSFARKVIEDYKKFIYLICVTGQTLTPSDEVDQVWHLHLTYTRDYWDEFCPKILGRKIHHGPTKGGEAQTQSFKIAYENTLKAYALEFGTPPPKAIWPDADTRFNRPQNFRRIDLSSVYLLPKWQVFLCLGGAVTLLLGACKASAIMERVDIMTMIHLLGLGFGLVTFVGWLGTLFKRLGKRKGGRHGDGGCGGGCSSSTSGDSRSHSGGDHDGGSGCSSDGGGSGCGGGCGGGD